MFTEEKEAVLKLDDEGKVIHINDKMVRMLGYSKTDVMGQKVEVMLPSHANLHIKDSLTVLHNRSAFEDAFSAAYRQSQTEAQTYALLFMDLDNFKTINDEYGHPMGDLVLSALAERMKTCIRPRDLLARLGGDEFGLILNKINSPKNAEKIAARFCKVIAAPLEIKQQKISLSISIGIVLLPTSVPKEEVILLADRAMYQIKKAGGNGWKYSNA